ncbi:MAG TPA: sulfite exporter TauE/SafE family protein, partial [Terriglobales bacterium]|nr:sulfite exporter TauE/SafE family protein [Terriglobales bacterium]
MAETLSLTAIIMLLAVAAGAGAFGALAGVGGGAIITPLLALYFGLPMHQAIGVGLIAVIATSTASSSVHVERHIVNVKLGMILESATTTGAAIAAVIAGYLSARWLAGIFIGFLAFSCYNMMKRAWTTRNEQLQAEIPPYTPENYPAGLLASVFAGALSG